jgi:hypothetical protein
MPSVNTVTLRRMHSASASASTPSSCFFSLAIVAILQASHCTHTSKRMTSMDEPTDPIYRPFTKHDEIRLLIIHPSITASSLLSCTLDHVSLSSSPTYDALSYVWGTNACQNAVLVNGKHRLIGKNLFLALKHLRLRTEDRVIWADALCIDQENDQERNHQVAQMGRIYSLAKFVRIWLGVPDLFITRMFTRLSTYEYSMDTQKMSFEANSLGFKKLCQQKYWSRLWIIQEVVLAQDVTIHSGKFTMTWAHFTLLLSMLRKLDPFENLSVVKLCDQRAALKQRELAIEKQHPQIATQVAGVSLVALVETHAQAQCVDRRDRVYGLHGLSPDCCRRNVPIGYFCTAYELVDKLLQHELIYHTMSNITPENSILWNAMSLHKILVQDIRDRSTMALGHIPRTISHPRCWARIRANKCGRITWHNRASKPKTATQ